MLHIHRGIRNVTQSVTHYCNIILPFIQFFFFDRVDVRQKGFHRFRMSLEEVEEGDHAHGLHVPV